eukprot:TRINITY_DN2723_c0_g1_i1.p1 TRINITY_DN2723_c0_g1~~TRINITY_DN2723_c0_g1_i1.p1  ORF type:complete len:522 (+),score=100.04 TRINITY_DN2723_c0_g1_i1:41-1606(+)
MCIRDSDKATTEASAQSDRIAAAIAKAKPKVAFTVEQLKADRAAKKRSLSAIKSSPGQTKRMMPRTAVELIKTDNPETTVIDLSSNTIFQMKSLEYATKMAAALTKNTNLVVLRLKSCNIADSAASKLGVGLKSNHALLELDLEGNKIGSSGVIGLAVGLASNDALQTINLMSQGKRLGEAALACVVKMFDTNITLTNIIWRLDSKQAWAITKCITRNREIDRRIREDKPFDDIDPRTNAAKSAVPIRSGPSSSASVRMPRKTISRSDDIVSKAKPKKAAATTDDAKSSSRSPSRSPARSPSPSKTKTAEITRNFTIRKVSKEDKKKRAQSAIYSKSAASNPRRKRLMPRTAIAALKENDPEMVKLDLSGNTLFQMKSVAYCAAMAEGLKVNTVCTEVHLKKCGISDSSVQKLALALKSNNTLVELDLEGNKIGSAGVTALAVGLAGNTALKTLNLMSQGKRLGEACLACVVKMFDTNITLTNIIWRLDSKQAWAITKRITRNREIERRIREGKPYDDLIN